MRIPAGECWSTLITVKCATTPTRLAPDIIFELADLWLFVLAHLAAVLLYQPTLTISISAGQLTSMRVGHRVCSTCRILATARPSAGGGGSSAAHRPPLAPILRSSSSGPGGPRSEEVRAREAARARAWYLDDTPSNPLTRSTSSPSSSGSSPIPPIRPQPRFTTYDPNRTTSTPSSSDPDLNPLIHLPTFAPDHLHPLHAFLVANELIEPGTVQFLHTPSSGVSGSDDSREVIVGDRGFEARWEWVGVCEVKGRGKGVVARAERSLRTWVSGEAI